MVNYASNAFLEKKKHKNMLIRPNYTENKASTIGKGLEMGQQLLRKLIQKK